MDMRFVDSLWLFNLAETRGISRLNIDEAALLRECLTSTPKDTNIVEVGVLNGGTSAFIWANSDRSNKCRCIDTDLNNIDDRIKEYLSGADNILFVKADSGTVDIPDIGLVLIDGDHTYEGCRRDIIQHARNVVVGGYMLLHDAMPNEYPGHCEGVYRCYEEICLDPCWEEVGRARSTVAFRRIR